MTIEARRMEFGGQVIDYTIVRRVRQTLEIAVEPDCSVCLVAPMDSTLEAIEAKLRKRAPWVLRQQRYFSQFLPRTTARRFIAGETHLYLGRQYRLKVVSHTHRAVKLLRGELVVQTSSPQLPEITKAMLDGWYKAKAQQWFADRLDICLQRFPESERFRPTNLLIRTMRQRWGSLSPGGRLLLNRRLIEAPVSAIDYVITHELCHIQEPNHGTAFVELLTRVMPDWQQRKAILEQTLA
jgi:predicted metal-dependent hydrolase